MLRIIAITLVVVQHIISTSSLSQQLQPFYFSLNFFDIFHVYYGNIGIWLFIFASGCSLALNYPNVDTIEALKNFFAKRALRIYPAYWAAILFNITIFNAVIPSLSLIDIAKLVSGFQAFFASTLEDFYGKVNGTFWFIGVIISLYLLYPIVLKMIRKRPNVSLFILLIIEISTRIIFSHIPGIVRGYDWFPLCRIFDFGLGIYVVQRNLFWKASNLSEPVTFLANISFPIYLVHIPLLVLVNYNIALFLLALVVISAMLYTFDVALRQRIKKAYPQIA
ncbi:MAG: acyltransferase family protein [Candidatus Bathyarchaeia archaeon]